MVFKYLYTIFILLIQLTYKWSTLRWGSYNHTADHLISARIIQVFAHVAGSRSRPICRSILIILVPPISLLMFLHMFPWWSSPSDAFMASVDPTSLELWVSVNHGKPWQTHPKNTKPLHETGPTPLAKWLGPRRPALQLSCPVLGASLRFKEVKTPPIKIIKVWLNPFFSFRLNSYHGYGFGDGFLFNGYIYGNKTGLAMSSNASAPQVTLPAGSHGKTPGE